MPGLERRNNAPPCPEADGTAIGSQLQMTLACARNIEGTLIDTLDADSLPVCVELCANTHPRCNAVTFSDGNSCRLIAQMDGDPERSRFRDAAIAIYPTLAASTCSAGQQALGGGQFSMQCGTIVNGGDLVQRHHRTIDDCAEDCGLTPGCAGFVFNAGLDQGFLNCYLKNDIPEGSLSTFGSVDTGILNAAVDTSPDNSDSTAPSLAPSFPGDDDDDDDDDGGDATAPENGDQEDSGLSGDERQQPEAGGGEETVVPAVDAGGGEEGGGGATEETGDADAVTGDEDRAASSPVTSVTVTEVQAGTTQTTVVVLPAVPSPDANAASPLQQVPGFNTIGEAGAAATDNNSSGGPGGVLFTPSRAVATQTRVSVTTDAASSVISITQVVTVAVDATGGPQADQFGAGGGSQQNAQGGGNGDGGENMAWVAAPVVGGIAAVLVVIVMFVMFRKKKRRNAENEGRAYGGGGGGSGVDGGQDGKRAGVMSLFGFISKRKLPDLVGSGSGGFMGFMNPKNAGAERLGTPGSAPGSSNGEKGTSRYMVKDGKSVLRPDSEPHRPMTGLFRSQE